jgi:hypothetical protein
MTTIKSYTDLNQSRKLADILPLESADMALCSKKQPLMTDYISAKKKFSNAGEIPIDPCWSLAALLDVLPPYLFEFERGIDLNVYPNLNGRGWHCSYMPNCIENMKTDKFKLITSGDTIVDACVEMIMRLNELKML